MLWMINVPYSPEWPVDLGASLRRGPSARRPPACSGSFPGGLPRAPLPRSVELAARLPRTVRPPTGSGSSQRGSHLLPVGDLVDRSEPGTRRAGSLNRSIRSGSIALDEPGHVFAEMLARFGHEVAESAQHLESDALVRRLAAARPRSASGPGRDRARRGGSAR